jgi:prepilin-type N-terminal cleavage/methylation domain-containing protein
VTMNLTNRNNRNAFTLVEMLVVVLIIGILVGLISAAAIRARNRAKATAIAVEVKQLELALEKYKTDMGGEYPPDFFGLGVPATDLAAKDRVIRHVRHAFPRFVLTGATIADTWLNLRDEIYNTTNPHIDINDSSVIHLNPSTALRFWLGGVDDAQHRPIGFSKDPLHPFDNTTPSRIGPFFEFDPGQLPNNPNTELGKYYPPGILTGSGQPYIYFRAELGQPQQFREYYLYDPTTSSYTFKTGPTSGVKPYWDQRTQNWINNMSFQILCCGLDGRFGQENVYPTGQVAGAGVPAGPPPPGTPDFSTETPLPVIGIDSPSFTPGNFDHVDDQTNFSSGTIGDDMP